MGIKKTLNTYKVLALQTQEAASSLETTAIFIRLDPPTHWNNSFYT
jgi:hypothetical protein